MEHTGRTIPTRDPLIIAPKSQKSFELPSSGGCASMCGKRATQPGRSRPPGGDPPRSPPRWQRTISGSSCVRHGGEGGSTWGWMKTWIKILHRQTPRMRVLCCILLSTLKKKIKKENFAQVLSFFFFFNVSSHRRQIFKFVLRRQQFECLLTCRDYK